MTTLFKIGTDGLGHGNYITGNLWNGTAWDAETTVVAKQLGCWKDYGGIVQNPGIDYAYSGDSVRVASSEVEMEACNQVVRTPYASGQVILVVATTDIPVSSGVVSKFIEVSPSRTWLRA